MALSPLLKIIQFFVEHDASDSSISFQKELIQEVQDVTRLLVSNSETQINIASK